MFAGFGPVVEVDSSTNCDMASGVLVTVECCSSFVIAFEKSNGEMRIV